MMKFKTGTPSQASKNWSFETWVLAIVSSLKAEGAEFPLPIYMCPGGASMLNSPSYSKPRDKGKMKVEDTSSNDHQTKLSTIIFKWTDP
jgi:hypothetical protein